eukprot:CAMPEP_0180192298 /NCGR_PEP_ID=MMETSP0987-20121128/1906_1 /TAXON_ID=697907 /ORGANISM="non described non described, Strain CCMP2293" /LENGTH=151 /DNA_ID=CAMNT_0022146917 /DNA_START=32 /DNA_END=486 /DNA_ORIENTATION=+
MRVGTTDAAPKTIVLSRLNRVSMPGGGGGNDEALLAAFDFRDALLIDALHWEASDLREKPADGPCNARKGHETRALLFCWRRPGLRAWTPGRLGPVVVPHACDASSLPPAVPGPWSSGLEGWETCEAISGNQAVGALRSLVLRPDSLEPVF